MPNTLLILVAVVFGGLTIATSVASGCAFVQNDEEHNGFTLSSLGAAVAFAGLSIACMGAVQ